MIDMNWYELIETAELLQGDLLANCPVFEPDKGVQWPIAANAEVGFRIQVLDLVVLTQSCDLANNKVEKVLLARVMPWQELVQNEAAAGNTAVKGSKFRKLLVDGNIPSLSLLHKREAEPSLPWSVVDFHHLFTLPKSFVTAFADSVGPRLRLCSPYREHARSRR